MRATIAVLLMFALSVTALAQPAAQKDGAAYVVIVHPSNPVSTLDRSFIADALLKKVSRWPDGESIKPVDLGSSAPARQRFTQDVLKRTMAAVRSYWQQLIFSGRNIPPPELESDQAVIAYVKRYPGAIGYVSGQAALDGVKVVSVK